MIHYLNTLSKVPVLISPSSNEKSFLCQGITAGCPNYSHMGPHQPRHTNALLCLTFNAHGVSSVTAETAFTY